MSYKKTFYKQTAGFTLIEVLITVVILSIGLLGMAGIQIQGLRGTASSSVRSQAAILANDMAERIRMNNDGLVLNLPGNPVNSDYTSVSIGVDAQGNPTLPCNAPPATLCSAIPGNAAVAGCTTAEMAAFDIFEFACGPVTAGNVQNLQPGGVQNLLPNGSATITCLPAACTPGSQVVINISWTEKNTAPGAQQGQNQLKNLSMVFIP